MTKPPQRRARRAVIYRQVAKVSREITDTIGTCPACGKRAYADRDTARATARRLFPGVPLRAYRCGEADRWWHLTSEDSGTTRRRRDEVVYRQGPVIVTGADAALAARFTAEVAAGTGAGPTWGQLAGVMGWPRWSLAGL
ncbi:MAG TPA: hypothetical protein VNH17_02055, partial [Streptosporangiaceae bacterium]|nr:hypothetical protein [Streptosporangiaceae bacterium]